MCVGSGYILKLEPGGVAKGMNLEYQNEEESSQE